MSAMATNVVTLGLNHQTAPLNVRGRFAFASTQVPLALASLRDRLGAWTPEAALLSTCNRTELYLATPTDVTANRAGDAVQPAIEWLAQQGGVSPGELHQHTYVMGDQACARHAFRVASGLDSMVLGETQILGQMKTAVRDADAAGMLGTTLHQLFQRSFAVAKEVRTATEVGAHSVSMAAALVRLAGELFEDLERVNVLLVGAGEMIELVATHFAARKPAQIAIANRTLERGEALAARFGAQAIKLADLPSNLHAFDVVISCTASTLPLIGLGAVERALKQRRHRPMLMADLAVPRDIEPEVSRLPDIYLYTVDDLAALVQTAGAKRQAAVAQAEAIIDERVQSFAHWLDQRATVPLIQALNQQADDWRATELARARKRLAKGDAVDDVLDGLARGLAQKMLHGTMSELRSNDADQRAKASAAVSRLWLRDGPPRE
jgi:glutamyl-tRNA reductase